MELRFFEDAGIFHDVISPLLKPQEPIHLRLISSVLSLRHVRQRRRNPPKMALVMDGETAVAAAASIRPQPFQVAIFDEAHGEAAMALLADQLASKIHSIAGEWGAAKMLANALSWSESSLVEERMVVWECRHPLLVDPAHEGEIRLARPDDVVLANDWIMIFHEQNGLLSDEDVAGLATKQLIQNENLFFWDDGEVRAMAAAAQRSERGVTIDQMFAPPGQENEQEDCLIGLTNHLLANGWEFTTCWLSEDEDVAARIGYVRAGVRAVITSS